MYKKKRVCRPPFLSETAETIRLLDRAIKKAGIPAEDREAFLNSAVAEMWNLFKTERMNRRILIENEIKALGIRLPNGTVKKAYSATILLPADKISDVHLSGVAELGLTFKEEGEGIWTLSGLPKKSGDFTLRLSYQTEPREPRSELVLPIAFNPSPRELWKDRKTPTDIDYYKGDTALEFVKVEAGAAGLPKKDMVAASRRGRSHAHEGRPRDDHFALYHSPESDWYVMAVADGAGSARYSREGSRIACQTVIDHCRERLLDNPTFEEAIRAWYADKDDKEKRTVLTRMVIEIIYNGALKANEAIKKEALAKESDNSRKHLQEVVRMKDYATTLMFAICKRFEFGWFITSFWVGDGAMCLFDAKSHTAKLLGTPDEGEFSGQTRFLTMSEIFHDKDIVQKRMRMAVVDDFTALFLMTDGVSDPLFETERNLNDYSRWEAFYDKLRHGFPDDEIAGVNLTDDHDAAGELLEWLNFWSQGNHDDRTLAVLY